MVTALKLTIAQLDALPDDNNRYELIDGELLYQGHRASGTNKRWASCLSD